MLHLLNPLLPTLHNLLPSALEDAVLDSELRMTLALRGLLGLLVELSDEAGHESSLAGAGGAVEEDVAHGPVLEESEKAALHLSVLSEEETVHRPRVVQDVPRYF